MKEVTINVMYLHKPPVCLKAFTIQSPAHVQIDVLYGHLQSPQNADCTSLHPMCLVQWRHVGLGITHPAECLLTHLARLEFARVWK